MKQAPFNMLLETASRDNILVLTTRCSTSCIFCSHLQNPKEIEAYYVDELSRDEINTLIEFLDGSRKIVIGESATRICEGEPFLSEGIVETLGYIRQKHQKAPIQITTSGISLDSFMLSELQRIGGIELNISLNSSSIQGRAQLYRGHAHTAALEAIKQLREYRLPFSGSIVAMPHVVGWEDVEATVSYLAENGASTIRIFMPGYTRFTRGQLQPKDIREGLQKLVEGIRKRTETPVLLEPPLIRDLHAVVEGVLIESPAQKSGIKTGDVIEYIDGKKVTSRVDAYYRLFELENPKVEFLRAGDRCERIVEKRKNEASGMVFNYDIHPDTIKDIERVLARNKGRRCLIATSELAYGILAQCIQITENIRLEAVENGFLGGNIMCAGLLTVKDIEKHLLKSQILPEVVLLPAVIFDKTGRDLLGIHFKELEETIGIKVEIV